jgi:phosphoserine phosphatase RsbU/P
MSSHPTSERNENFQSRFELRTLLDTSRLLVESNDLEFVLNNLLLICMGKLLTTKGMLLLFERDKKQYRVAKSKGITGYNEHQLIDLDCREMLSRNTVLTAEMSNDEDNGMPVELAGHGVEVVFNIRTSNEHLGLLCLGKKATSKAYSRHELEFIENLVIISAVGISNSLLVSRLKKANRELDKKVQEMHTLFDISKEFNAMVERPQILNVFKFALLGQMFIRSFFFVMDDEDKPEILTMSGIRGELLPDQMSYMLREFDEVKRIDIETRQMIPFLEENGIEALIPVQIQQDKAIIGVGKRATGESYSESDFNFLSSLGNVALLSVLKTYLLEERIEKERIEEELNIARTIQKKLFPNKLPVPGGYDLAAINVPSQQVGGDYYDCILHNDEHLYMVIGDVTGKGIPASLLMANLQAMIHVIAPLGIGLPESTAKINDIIYRNTPSDKFISFFWGCLDLNHNRFTYCNAGHNPPVFLSADSDKPKYLSKGGMLLGALPTMNPYESDTIEMKKGDVIMLYTDGVSEAMDSDEQEYGELRLVECINQNKKGTARSILNGVLEDVKIFCKNNYNDDLTALVLKTL